MKGVSAKEVASGCPGGCLGCFALLALLVLQVWFVFLLPTARYEKWSGFPGALDKLHPGMTEEEVRAAFPSHCTFEEENQDGFEYHTWVTSLDAVPMHTLKVEPGQDTMPSDLVMTFGAFLSHTFGANLYFDADGRLVGVHVIAWEDGTWNAEWGMLNDEQWKKERGYGKPCNRNAEKEKAAVE